MADFIKRSTKLAKRMTGHLKSSRKLVRPAAIHFPVCDSKFIRNLRLAAVFCKKKSKLVQINGAKFSVYCIIL